VSPGGSPVAQAVSHSGGAGKALQVIRDAPRLCRGTHATFEDYIEQRWDMSRSPAYRLIDAWPLAERLSPMGDKLNERQVRELLPLASRHSLRRELYSTARPTRLRASSWS
jgi:hypothetical protein